MVLPAMSDDAGVPHRLQHLRPRRFRGRHDRQAAILGAEAHAPVKRSELRARIIVEDDLPASPASLRDVLERGGTYQTEYRVDAGDGTQRWVSTRGMPTFIGRTIAKGFRRAARNRW